ncbi:hypothetical protein SUGI_0726770 [Cryptomeria japonica]|uniref:cysteine-rich repeat secretory protein 38-like n=1 Tax=Cryptomeria japonica TaxID=3369 RepID=UPI002414A3AE|nr:cysteine-rich repeat secretory protein 38-like [Cryptomeria japonica]GLJ36206.1 hypothetical protein SUGI_0726770 [Cryptomeria japonica]
MPLSLVNSGIYNNLTYKYVGTIEASVNAKGDSLQVSLSQSFQRFKMSLLLLFLMIVPSVLCSDYRWSSCDNPSTYAEGSKYSTNLNQVLNDLSFNAPKSLGFNTSFRGTYPNEVYGLLQCMGYISPAKCSDCSRQAINSSQEYCPNNMGVRVWMEQCFLHYDNNSFISTLDATPIVLSSYDNVTGNIENFKATTSSLLSFLSDTACTSANKLFAVGSATYSTSNQVYGLVQCWRDLSINDCKSCLDEATQALEEYYTQQGAQVLSGSCTVRYEVYPFFEALPQGMAD